MAKKKRKRDWFIPMFEQGLDTVYQDSQFPIGCLAFDSFNNAHAFAAHLRLSPVRDESGELVLDENGKAVLPDYGKINVVQIKTDKIDWKNVTVVSPTFHLRGMRITSDVIEFDYTFPYSKHTVVGVLEEPEEMYKKSSMSGAVIMTQILQVRDKFLRLNNEQVQHVLNGIVEQRKNIDPDSVPIYDGEMNNIIEQLEQQGVYVQIAPQDEAIADPDERQQAQTILAELYADAMSLPTDMKQGIFNKIQKLEHLLFGE